MINGSQHTYFIPIDRQGFAWDKQDFDRLLVFEPPRDAPGNVCGRGVPIVVLTPARAEGQLAGSACKIVHGAFGSNQDPCGSNQDADGSSAVSGAVSDAFTPASAPFAATAVIKLSPALFDDCHQPGLPPAELANFASFTLVNPLAGDELDGSPRLAQSPAMPLIYAREQSQYNPVTAFLSGDNGVDEPRLFFLEPYQSEKIPLIFVHGLLSNPAAFLDMADIVRADPMLRRRYQIWVFRYPTGDDFLESGAALRRQLAAAFACRNPGHAGCEQTHENQTAHQAVIVGHSMGGLVAKLQVTDSGDRMWRAISNVPLEQRQGPPATLANLRRSFFFEANPNIGRVVYIATPHQGAPWAARLVGRMGATLARRSTRERTDYEAISLANPGALKGGYDETFPSSVDLLQPDSRLLLRLSYTASAPGVRVNSIIGDCCHLPRSGPSDQVVPVDSAYRSEAESTTIVDATHTLILRSPAAQQELLRILRVHLETQPPAEQLVWKPAG